MFAVVQVQVDLFTCRYRCIPFCPICMLPPLVNSPHSLRLKRMRSKLWPTAPSPDGCTENRRAEGSLYNNVLSTTQFFTHLSILKFPQSILIGLLFRLMVIVYTENIIWFCRRYNVPRGIPVFCSLREEWYELKLSGIAPRSFSNGTQKEKRRPFYRFRYCWQKQIEEHKRVFIPWVVGYMIP